MRNLEVEILEEEIHIVFSIYDSLGDYSKYVGTTMLSVFANTKSSLEIHLLHDETLSENNKEKFKLLCKKYNHKINFYNVSLPENLKICKGIERFSPASLYRLFIPDLLSHIDKVIYLDGDIISFLDVKELWEIDVEKFSLAAVKDKVTEGIGYKEFSQNKFFKRIAILNDCYFNAGVLLLNLKKIRAKYDMRKECFSFLTKNPDAPALDQESLNFLFQNDCLFLEKKFNMSPEEISLSDFENGMNPDCILHFYTWDKPWKTNTYFFNNLYWKYFKMTPWGEDIDAFIGAVMKASPALDEGILFQPIRSKKVFVKNFYRRLLSEIKLKLLKNF